MERSATGPDEDGASAGSTLTRRRERQERTGAKRGEKRNKSPPAMYRQMLPGPVYVLESPPDYEEIPYHWENKPAGHLNDIDIHAIANLTR